MLHRLNARQFVKLKAKDKLWVKRGDAGGYIYRERAKVSAPSFSPLSVANSATLPLDLATFDGPWWLKISFTACGDFLVS